MCRKKIDFQEKALHSHHVHSAVFHLQTQQSKDNEENHHLVKMFTRDDTANRTQQCHLRSDMQRNDFSKLFMLKLFTWRNSLSQSEMSHVVLCLVSSSSGGGGGSSLCWAAHWVTFLRMGAVTFGSGTTSSISSASSMPRSWKLVEISVLNWIIKDLSSAR